MWQYLESEAGNDFSAGFSWLHNEINYIKANYPGKQIGFMIQMRPLGGNTATLLAQWPDYLVNAGCVNTVDAQINIFHFDNPTCVGYLNRLLAAYGAEFDSEPALEFVRIDQETNPPSAGKGYDRLAWDTGLRSSAAAAATAFPTTNINIPLNWIGNETAAAKESLLAYYKSINVGVGAPDTQPIGTPSTGGAYPCPSTSLPCVILGQNASLGASSHNYCGEVLSMPAVETSELGYNSVTDPPGGLTSQQVANSFNNDYCAQYGIWDYNMETGDPDTMQWNGAHGQKWAIDGCSGACPLTHTTKPAGYR